MTKAVRVRFAPSPTGPLHIGGVRTALFNYLFAKKHKGTFYLRIEDTDQTRFVPGAEAYIFEALEWLGIAPDETVSKNEKFGPYRQSERKAIYQSYINELIENDWAYYAFDSAETLDNLRKEAERAGKTFIYNHTVREQLDNSIRLSKEETQKRIANGEAYVVRFKTPVNQILEIHDLIRGDVKFDTNLLDDKVLFKSDGMPTYHLANIVDDHLMETSHVIRGEEWLPSLPLHHLLYQAFGWEAPEFAHLPLILKPVGNGKLSKRDGDKMGFPVFPLEWKTAEGTSMGYREQGYFPEAVVNFLALLGWNDGTEKELFTLQELIESFDLKRIHKAGAKFDPEKNKWFNHQYLKQKRAIDLIDELEKQIKYKIQVNSSKNTSEKIIEELFKSDRKKACSAMELVMDRLYFPMELIEDNSYFFVSPEKSSIIENSKKIWKENTSSLMNELINIISTIDDSLFTSNHVENKVKEWMTANEIGMGKIMQPFRLCIVGAMKGPHLFDIVEIIGKEETIKRINLLVESRK